MSLPTITARLPAAVESSQACRIRDFLQHVDDNLQQPLVITVYGSAAIALYLADETLYEYGYTRDIDVGHMEPDKLIGPAIDRTAVDPPLHFQTYDFTLWLIHPDWCNSVVDVSSLVGTKLLTMRLLHPYDLIITKLERAAPQDLEDGILLRDRYIDSVDEMRRRVSEAIMYYSMSERAANQIEFSFEAIFEEPLDLV
jgi:hypothetical protein